MNTIGTEKVKQALKDSNFVVVDTRRSEAFNGWKMDGLEIEGHIKGATDFSSNWLNIIREGTTDILLDFMDYKGITSDKNIILYDSNGRDSKEVAKFFNEHGLDKLSYYDLAEWNGEVEAYAHYERIVPVEWVKDVIDGKKPEHFKGGDYKIFEVSWKEAPEEFIKNHIPGSVHIDSNEFECLPAWIHRSHGDLEEFAINNGIDVDTTVIVYGCGAHSLAAAYKLASILKYIGVSDVRPISGGLEAWIRAGYETESGNPKKQSNKSFSGSIPGDTSQIITIEEAKYMLKHPEDNQLLDIRSWKQFIGEDTGYDYCPTAGRIPGSMWIGNMRDTNVDGSMRNLSDIKKLWKSKGVDENKNLTFYCGSAAWGGAISKFYADLAEFGRTSIFEGGWFEWQLDEDNPYEVGIPEGYTESGERK